MVTRIACSYYCIIKNKTSHIASKKIILFVTKTAFFGYIDIRKGGEAVNDDKMEQIYKEHAQIVYKYLLSTTHDVQLAEDLTQETFYRAINSIERYDGSCKVSVWLCQIAKHLWYQELEKRSKYKTQELREDIPSTLTLEDDVLSSNEKLELYKAIQTLDATMKEVVLLRLSGELSFAEIGAILSKNENWARVTFYRAKQKIKEVYKC